MREVGRTAAAVAVLGAIVPLAAGLAVGYGAGEDTATTVFIGVALVATSVGITSAVLLDLGALNTRAARTILGAAVIDDVIAMLRWRWRSGWGRRTASTSATSSRCSRWPSVHRVLRDRRHAADAGAPAALGRRGSPSRLDAGGDHLSGSRVRLPRRVGGDHRSLPRRHDRGRDQASAPHREEVAPLYAFFPPFFFASIGIEVDLGTLADSETLAVARRAHRGGRVTKYAGARLGARGLGPADARVVGVGMVPRGEVGIIVAGIGSAAGVVDDELFAVIVGMSVLTTLIAPALLRRLTPEAGDPGLLQLAPAQPQEPDAAGPRPTAPPTWPVAPSRRRPSRPPPAAPSWAGVEPVRGLVERVDRLAEDHPDAGQHVVEDDRERRAEEGEPEGDAAEHADHLEQRSVCELRELDIPAPAGEQVADRGGQQAGTCATSASGTPATTLAAITRSRRGTSENVVSAVRCDHSLVTARMPSTGSSTDDDPHRAAEHLGEVLVRRRRPQISGDRHDRGGQEAR